MKDFRRILATLMALLLHCGTMSAFAELDATLDALSLVEEATGAACAVSNADGEASEDIYSHITMDVGQNKYLVPAQSSHTGRFSATSVSSDPNIVEARGRRVKALAPGRCIVTLTLVFEGRRTEPVVRKYDITVVGGPALAANGKR